MSDHGGTSGSSRSLLSVENVDPYSFYEARRAEGNLVWDQEMSAWLVLSYAECRHIETNEDQFANPYANAPPIVVKVKGGPSNITLTRGDQHARMRHFHMKLLAPAEIARYRETMVKPIISFVLDRIEARGSADLAADLGDQIPPRVIIALLGLPWRDDDLVERTVHLHEEIMYFIGHNYSKELEPRALKASADIEGLLIPYVRARKEKPKDDFISRVWSEAPNDFGEMTEEIALGICREIFLGGTDTTMHAIANAFYLLLSDAKVRATVEADREAAMRPLIEETMRLYGSVQYRYRVAVNDCEIAGVQVKQGQRLVLLHAAANRDPAKYACPAAADSTRQPINDHLAFNMGPRACVGAQLARVEIRDTVDAALTRLPGLKLDPTVAPPTNTGLFLRSFRPLHAIWGAR